MRRLVAVVWRLAKGVPLAVFASLVFLGSGVVLLVADVFRPRGRAPKNTMPDTRSASVVIPNWNGRDLLEKYLPSVVEAMAGSADNEVIVVDNGSEDGSAEFVRTNFPTVTLVALKENQIGRAHV